jgi:5'-3' exonuclease
MGITGKKNILDGVSTSTIYLSSHKKSNCKFKKDILIIDAFYVIYKYSIGLYKFSKNVIDKNGININEIHVVYNIAINLLKNNITPIFVFDGAPMKIKQNTINKRKIKKELSLKKTDGIMTYKSYRPSNYNIKTCIQLLNSMGITVINNKNMEADPICGIISYKYNKRVLGILTDDLDIILHGGNALVSIDGLKMKKLNIITRKSIIKNMRDKATKIMGYYCSVNMDDLIKICSLLGNDYCKRYQSKFGIKKSTFEDVIQTYFMNNKKLNFVIRNREYCGKLINTLKYYTQNYENKKYIKLLEEYFPSNKCQNIIIEKYSLDTFSFNQDIDIEVLTKICNYFMEEKDINTLIQLLRKDNDKNNINNEPC